MASRLSARAAGLAADGAAVLALIVLAWFALESDPYGPVLYQGGFVLVAIAAALLIAAVVHPLGRIGSRILDRQPLRWIGLRSYSIYLWHWPIFMVTRPGVDLAADGLPVLVLRLGLTAVLAEFSYRVVESPIRGGALGRAWRGWRASPEGLASGASPRRRRMAVGGLVAGGLAAAVLVAAAVGVVTAQAPGAPAYLVGIGTAAPGSSQVAVAGPPIAPGSPTVPGGWAMAGVPGGGSAPSGGPAAAVGPSGTSSASDPMAPQTNGSPAPTGGGVAEASALPPPPPTTTPPQPTPIGTAAGPSLIGATSSTLPPAATSRPAEPTASPRPTRTPTRPAPPAGSPPAVLAIGDSVMAGGAQELRQAVGSIEVDALIDRQFLQGLYILVQRRQAGLLPATVVVHLGTNGPFTPHQLDLLMQSLAGVHRVVLVNVKMPNGWEGYVNQVLAQNVGRYRNAILLDWHAASVNRPELFWADGTHLRPLGAQVYAALIAAAVR